VVQTRGIDLEGDHSGRRRMMDRRAKDIASRLSEFRDAHEEYKETKDPKALERRHKAMFADSPEIARRAADKLATESFEEGQRRRDKLQKAKFTGWKKKKEN
jgi:hypothetical protein